MKRIPTPRTIARGLAVLFTVMWWWLIIASTLVAVLVATRTWDVGVQIGPNGEPNFVVGSKAQMVLPVAFELEAGAAQVKSDDGLNTGAIEKASGLLRLATPERRWLAFAAAASMMALTLWIVAELAALCRSIRDGQPFAPANAGRVRRLALAFVLAELSRVFIVYRAHAYAAAHFGADHVRFTASADFDGLAIVTTLILLVLAEAFRTGTRLDEEQSLTV
jgi:hypothetical protein